MVDELKKDLAPLVVVVRQQLTSALLWRAEWLVIAAIATVLVVLGILIASPMFPFTSGAAVGGIWYVAVALARAESERLRRCYKLLEFLDKRLQGDKVSS